VAGFAYLEPKCHIRHITELDGPEAATFGPAMARSTQVLKEATGAELVYVYIFGGGIPHLHVHLAPHRSGDGLNDQMIRGEIVEEKLPNGMTRFTSSEFPALPRDQLVRIADEVRRGMSSKDDLSKTARGRAATDAHWWHHDSLGGGTCCRNLVACERACHGPAAKPAGWLRRHSRTQYVKARRPPPRQPKNRLMMNSTRKMKNNTCAMLDAVAAMPPNPKYRRQWRRPGKAVPIQHRGPPSRIPHDICLAGDDARLAE
jgi:diadenosine tetraphosphate (Ap4A) HIT family hydrolase